MMKTQSAHSGEVPLLTTSPPAPANSVRARPTGGHGVIEFLEISHFRQVSSAIHIPLRPITLIVGSTGCGKSCVRDALRFIEVTLNGSESTLLDLSSRWTDRSAQSDPRPINLEVGLGPTNLAEARGRARKLRNRVPGCLVLVEDERNPLWLESNRRPRVSLTVQADVSGISLMQISASEQTLMKVQRVDQEGRFSLVVNQERFGLALWHLASQEHGMRVTTDHDFACEVTWRHGPLRLKLADPSKQSEFERDLVALGNFLICQVGELIQPPTFVGPECDLSMNTMPTFKASATVVTKARRHSPALEPRVAMSEVHLGNQSPLPSSSPSGRSRLDFTAPLSQLAESWLQSDIRARAEFQMLRLGLDVPPAREAKKPWRDPFFATPQGEQEAYMLGREPNSPLVEPLHLYVNRQVDGRLFPNRCVQIRHTSLHVRQREPGKARGGSKLKASGRKGASLRVSGLVQSEFVSIDGATIDPRDLGAGMRSALPALVGLHAGYCYLEHAERHFDEVMQEEFAGIILDRVKSSPCTLLLESTEPRFIRRLLKALIEPPGSHGSSHPAQKLCSDQISVVTFYTKHDGTSSATWTTFSQLNDFLDEKIDEILLSLERQM